MFINYSLYEIQFIKPILKSLKIQCKFKRENHVMYYYYLSSIIYFLFRNEFIISKWKSHFYMQYIITFFNSHTICSRLYNRSNHMRYTVFHTIPLHIPITRFINIYSTLTIMRDATYHFTYDPIQLNTSLMQYSSHTFSVITCIFPLI